MLEKSQLKYISNLGPGVLETGPQALFLDMSGGLRLPTTTPERGGTSALFGETLPAYWAREALVYCR